MSSVVEVARLVRFVHRGRSHTVCMYAGMDVAELSNLVAAVFGLDPRRPLALRTAESRTLSAEQAAARPDLLGHQVDIIGTSESEKRGLVIFILKSIFDRLVSF